MWADKLELLELSEAERPHVCGLSVDYSGKCFRCDKQLFTRDEVGEINPSAPGDDAIIS